MEKLHYCKKKKCKQHARNGASAGVVVVLEY
jgi:hypothetical protein